MFNNCRLAVRRLIKTPAFTALAILTLALATDANTAIFSVADAVLFRPLPYADPNHLYALANVDSFYGAFDVRPGHRLCLQSRDRVRIW